MVFFQNTVFITTCKRSCGKVMFLLMFVCPQWVSQYAHGQGNMYSSMHLGRRGVWTGVGCGQGGCGQGCVDAGSGRGVHPPATPPMTVTEAGGTHPTGMHSCYRALLPNPLKSALHSEFTSNTRIFLKI